VILANADFIGGFGLWLDEEGKLDHTYSFPASRPTDRRRPSRFRPAASR